MNQLIEGRALDRKWHSIYGQILSDRKLMIAWENVKSNNGAGGIDGVQVEDFKVNEEEYIMEILRELRAKEYTPTPVRRVYIPKKNNGKRPLGIPIIKDRIIQQAVKNVLEPKFEDGIFHKWSCGYRPNLGAERVLQIIMWNIDCGYNYIYDADIKSFFDTIPHKKMMRVLNQYVADGTVLDMIWKWMKAGYMEEGNYYTSEVGTPAGGVISPLLANVYLNELDWDLEEAGIRFVRFADDFLLFAKSKEAIKAAAEVAINTLKRLGLEIASGKTKFVDFKKDDFDFMGFTFEHWTKSSQSGWGYDVKPSKSSIKDFKRKIKNKTVKTWTLSQEIWVKTLNPIIRGKLNYYKTPLKALRANAEYGLKSRCRVHHEFIYESLDSFTRRRLRVCMIHRNPTVKKGMAMTLKWPNMHFHKIGLVSVHMEMTMDYKGWDKDWYYNNLRIKRKKKYHSSLKNAAMKGVEYFTPHRIEKIRNSKKFCTN